MITEDTVVAVADGLSVAELDGEAVILSSHTGTYFGLNEAGARAFVLAQRPRRVREILETMLREYDAPRERLREDVIRLFGEMEEARLIETVEAGTDGMVA